MDTITVEQERKLQRVAENLWILRYDLDVLGDNLGRVVTIIRLSSGKLIIHSSAPFSPEDVAAISALGEPAWLVEANLLHDTYAKEAKAAFPDLPYMAPAGFMEGSNLEFTDILPAPSEWTGEVKTTLVEGMPILKEYVFLHEPTRTLIVGDLVHNYDEKETPYEWALRHLALGVHGHPSVTRVGALAIADKTLFANCVGAVLTWDFDRLIVGHKQMIDRGAKALLAAAIERAFPDLKPGGKRK